ncbi:sugar ABC transporter permease [Clostridium oceanicum]|uniref:ABC transporter permease subunit n=1 Tax=Clostridium oceanicum TaxID=1543 RepID=A0ABN1JEX5_9CLOT
MRKKLKPYIMLMPVLFIIIFILSVAIVSSALESVGYYKVAGLNHFTFKYYIEVIKDKGFLTSIKFSFYTSMVSSTISIILGIVISYFIFTKNNKNKFLYYIYKFPIVIPHAVVAFLIISMLSQGGILARIFYSLSIISSQNFFPNFIFDKKGIGIIITYIWKEMPFVVLMIYAVLSNIDKKIWEAAINLGASKRQAFLYVMIPMIRSTIFSSFILIFTFSFGAFEVPYLIGPTTPKALPVRAYLEYSNPSLLNRPYAMATNMILIIISLILIFFYEKSYFRAKNID